MPQIDWTIHAVVNCAMDAPFPDCICNACTQGLTAYGHPEFQLVLHMNSILDVLNTLGLRVRAGEQFSAGQMVTGIFEDCRIRLDEFEENGRTVLRVIVPDARNRWPEDPGCDYPYRLQTLPLDRLVRKG